MRNPNHEREIQAAFDGYIKRPVKAIAMLKTLRRRDPASYNIDDEINLIIAALVEGGGHDDVMIERMNRALAKADLEAERAGNFENELDTLTEALKPFASVPPGGRGDTERLIVVSAGSGPYHFLESDLARAKAALRREV